MESTEIYYSTSVSAQLLTNAVSKYEFFITLAKPRCLNIKQVYDKWVAKTKFKGTRPWNIFINLNNLLH
jgi:hypothetical protein